MHKIFLLRGAEDDLFAIYDRHEHVVAERMHREIKHSLELIAHFPGIGRITFGMQRFKLEHFPIGIFYRADGSRIFVHGFIDLRMDPKRIAERLKY